MTPHGGTRPGAGRPRLADQPTIEITITMPTSLAEKASRLGEGNRSEGIRRALEAYAEIVLDEEEPPALAGIDLDGTILNYDGQADDIRVNHALIAQLQADGIDSVAIISNQGGINFHDASPTTYPSAVQVARRIETACAALDAAGIGIVSVDIAVFHPRAASDAVAKSAAALRNELLSLSYSVPVSVWENSGSRKPSGTALGLARIAVYYGDSDEDAAAAQAAGARFVRVSRFQ